MSIVKIGNEELVVSVSSLGAQIISVADNSGKEYIWCGDKEIWGKHAPILFPIVSGLKNDRYTFQGKEYILSKHGFAQSSEFAIEEETSDSVTFIMKSNEATRAVYPFEFEFRVRYTVSKRKLTVDFITANKTNGDMYYSVGAHEAYALCNDISDYSIVLDEKETLFRYEVTENDGIQKCNEPCFNDTDVLLLNEDYFKTDAIIFFDMKSKGLSLVNNKTGDRIHVDFPGFETVLIWKKPGAAFVCIEPWAGAPEVPWCRYNDFSDKYRIRRLKTFETEVLSHTIEFQGAI